MKSKSSLILALMILLLSKSMNADPIIHKFELWGKGTNADKLHLYWGWTDGYLLARGKKGKDLGVCLKSMSTVQALAMIDKYYKDHPEEWSIPLGQEILKAVTVKGGPCESKDNLLLIP